MNNHQTAREAELKAENDALRVIVNARGKALFEALGALSSMWNQYCPPPHTHRFMNAGEDAEQVLHKWGLIREDESSVYLAGIVIDDDIPEQVIALVKDFK